MDSFRNFYFPPRCCVCLGKPDKMVDVKLYGTERDSQVVNLPLCATCAKKQAGSKIAGMALVLTLTAAGFAAGYLAFMGSEEAYAKYFLAVILAFAGFATGQILAWIWRRSFPLRINAKGEVYSRNGEYNRIYQDYNESAEVADARESGKYRDAEEIIDKGK